MKSGFYWIRANDLGIIDPPLLVQVTKLGRGFRVDPLVFPAIRMGNIADLTWLWHPAESPAKP